VIALERRLLDFSTSRKLSSSQRAMLDYCTTITAEAISTAPSQVAARYYALFHLLPRMLVTETSLRRAKASAPRPYWSQGKKKQQQRHRHASSTHEDTVFRSRCYAFLTGNWAPLLAVHPSARRITHETDDKKLSLDILALVHGGQLSRAMWPELTRWPSPPPLPQPSRPFEPSTPLMTMPFTLIAHPLLRFVITLLPTHPSSRSPVLTSMKYGSANSPNSLPLTMAAGAMSTFPLPTASSPLHAPMPPRRPLLLYPRPRR
jgi:hypothetical protein